jgi:hypothetical protein
VHDLAFGGDLIVGVIQQDHLIAPEFQRLSRMEQFFVDLSKQSITRHKQPPPTRVRYEKPIFCVIARGCNLETKKMRGWFGRKSAPERQAFVPAWLQGEGEQGGFARGYQAQLDEVYPVANPVGLARGGLVGGPRRGAAAGRRGRKRLRWSGDGLLERAAASLLLTRQCICPAGDRQP